MRTKEEILEDIEILESSMMHSDNPEYSKILDDLTRELVASINHETKIEFLDEVCTLEHHIQNWVNPKFVVSFSKIRDTVNELRKTSLPF